MDNPATSGSCCCRSPNQISKSRTSAERPTVDLLGCMVFVDFWTLLAYLV